MSALTPAAAAVVIAVAGVFGLVIGSFLNVVVHRVPAHVPLTRESRCPACDAPVRAWQNVPVVSWLALRGRCASCGEGIPSLYPAVEAATGAAFATIAWWAVGPASAGERMPGGAAVLLAYLWFAGAGIALALIDLQTRRLPRAITLPTIVVGFVLFSVSAIVGGEGSRLSTAILAAIASWAFYRLLRAIRPSGIGGGDVTLAAVVGLYTGWVGWGAVIVGCFATFLLAGVFGILLMLTRRAGRRAAIAFGPWMLAGAWIGIIWGADLTRWYLTTTGLAG